MKKFLSTLGFISIFLTAGFFLNKVRAEVTLQNSQYDVEINIENDSTFTVKETIQYKAYGDFHGLRRDIILENPRLTQACINNPNQTCGGFDKIIPIAVYDITGKKLLDNEYSIYEFQDEDSEIRYLRYEREYFKNGKSVNGEEFGWTIEYKILGGIEWIQNNAYFYWNILPENRGSLTKKSTITINFPTSVDLNKNNLTLYDEYPTQSIEFTGRTIKINLSNISGIGNYTLSYKFETNELEKPATLNYLIKSPHFGNEIYLDGIKIEDKQNAALDYIPLGNHEIKISHWGYKDSVHNLNFLSGEIKNLEVNLEPEDWMSVLLLINTLTFLSGIILVPLAISLVGYRYYKKGRDLNRPKTIIPLFSPPEDVHPYLLGTIKDETVDKVDIIGSIIDLAYRGYIKIKEIDKGKNYQLIRLKGKQEDKGVNETEQLILDSLFGNNTQIETKNLATRFPYKYKIIQSHIYKELVKKGYFFKSPETTRTNYLGCGVVVMVLGLISVIIPTVLFSAVIGYLFVFSPGIALAVAGIGFIIVAKFMPAKTELGSKIYGEILGFKMYLHTAERYRLQNLGPDEFERYLSYAIVFGIEKEWAEKFKDIYKQVPDWYEGTTTGDIWTAIWVSSLVRSFSDSTITNITPVSSGGSSSGGGWSGSGSFGGFSGGGGGGGSSGGW